MPEAESDTLKAAWAAIVSFVQGSEHCWDALHILCSEYSHLYADGASLEDNLFLYHLASKTPSQPSLCDPSNLFHIDI